MGSDKKGLLGRAPTSAAGADTPLVGVTCADGISLSIWRGPCRLSCLNSSMKLDAMTLKA